MSKKRRIEGSAEDIVNSTGGKELAQYCMTYMQELRRVAKKQPLTAVEEEELIIRWAEA